MAALIALLLQDPVLEAFKKLGSDLVEERDEAARALRLAGPRALAALRGVLESADPETRARAERLVWEIDRPERERRHDAERRKAVFAADPALPDEPGWKKIDGLAVAFSVRAHGEGLVVTARLNANPRVRLFREMAVADAEGRELTVERCGRCGPELVFVKHPGPVVPTMRGTRRWFSAYDVEFKNPRNGDRREIGDFILEVAWPGIRVTSAKELPALLMNSLASLAFDLRDGTPVDPVLDFVSDIPLGGRRVVEEVKPAGWCRCPGGPRPPANEALPVVRECFADLGGAPGHALENVGRIRGRFAKPFDEPFEVKGPALKP